MQPKHTGPPSLQSSSRRRSSVHACTAAADSLAASSSFPRLFIRTNSLYVVARNILRDSD